MENARSFIGGADIVVDALDNIPVRLLLQEVCCDLRLPLVHGALAGFIGEVMTIFPGEAGLRSFFRKGLRPPDKGIEVEVGTPSVTPAYIAALEAMEVLKVVTGKGRPIENKILYAELEEMGVTEIDLSG
jgi:molybdopterin/thiamine biosynthesis adenylyltransferase